MLQTAIPSYCTVLYWPYVYLCVPISSV